MKFVTVSVVLCIMLMSAPAALAQSSASYEEDTRYLYDMARWTALVQLSKRALDAGFETYSIRYRYSVALFETGRWNEAEQSLERTIELNPFDGDARTMLRDLYLRTGRHNEADRIRKVPFVRMFAIEYGQKSSDSDDVGILQYADLSLRHRLAKGSSVTWSVGGLDQDVYWGSISQRQGYARIDQAFRSNFTLTVAATALEYSYDVVANGTSDQDIAWTGSVELGKRFQDLAVVAQASITDVYDRKNRQLGVKLDTYPGLWASWRVSVNPFLVADESLSKRGISASVHWYGRHNAELAISGYSSDAFNVVEDAGYIVNNSLDRTRYRVGLYAQRNIVRRVPVFSLVQYERKEERFFGFWYNSVNWFVGIKYQL